MAVKLPGWWDICPLLASWGQASLSYTMGQNTYLTVFAWDSIKEHFNLCFLYLFISIFEEKRMEGVLSCWWHSAHQMAAYFTWMFNGWDGVNTCLWGWDALGFLYITCWSTYLVYIPMIYKVTSIELGDSSHSWMPSVTTISFNLHTRSCQYFIAIILVMCLKKQSLSEVP